MSAPIPVETAQRAYDAAYFGGASSETILRLGRELGEARDAAETIDQRCFRLGLKAADKDAEADRHWFAEADAAGRAAFRRLSGNDDTVAASFDREALACRSCALDAMAEAERIRSQIRSLRRAQSYADGVVHQLRGAA